ncbi:unnamed protein product, partial [Mesorhabditis spiculigera]
MEGVGVLEQGDAVRVSGGGGQQLSSDTGAEVIVWGNARHRFLRDDMKPFSYDASPSRIAFGQGMIDTIAVEKCGGSAVAE